MNKPLSVAVNELRLNIENAINTCGLPATIQEPLLYSYWLQLREAACKLLEEEARAYKAGQEAALLSPDDERKDNQHESNQP